MSKPTSDPQFDIEEENSTHCYADYEFVKELSSGAFGRVLIMNLKQTGEPFVMKRVPFKDPIKIQMAMQEVDMLLKVQSENIVRLVEWFKFDIDLCIVMEFCKGGNLRGLVEKMKTMNKQEKIQMAHHLLFQILSALNFMHSLQIIHRDLKPDNIFLDEYGNAKTGDFGLAQKMDNASYIIAAGTKCYSPPEALINQQMKFVSDIWALAVIIVELLAGQHPFEGKSQQQTLENITKGKMAPLPSIIEGELKEMLLKMLDNDCLKRPSAEELLQRNVMILQSQIEDGKKIIRIQRPRVEAFRLVCHQSAQVSLDLIEGVERTVKNLKTVFLSVPFIPVIRKGVYRCNISFNTNDEDQNRCAGIVSEDFNIPYPCPPDQEPQNRKMLFFNGLDGTISYKGEQTEENDELCQNINQIGMELDMNTGILRFFVDNVQQPAFVTGIKKPVKFFSWLYWKDSSFTIVSLKQLPAPTGRSIRGEKAVKW